MQTSRILGGSNIREEEHKKLKKYQGLRAELEKMWRVKATVVPVVILALDAVTNKPGEWLQQILEEHLRSLSRRTQQS